MLNFSYLLNKGEQIELEDNMPLIPIIVPTRNSERKIKTGSTFDKKSNLQEY